MLTCGSERSISSFRRCKKRTQGAADLVRAGVGSIWGRSATYGAKSLERTRMGPMGVPTTRQASCGLAVVTTVAAVDLSLKQGSSVQRDLGRSL